MKKQCFALLVSVGLAAACTKIVYDEVPPRIENYSLNGKNFEPGEWLTASFDLADDRELEQVRLRIESAFSKNFGDWYVLRIDDVNGTDYQAEMSFFIPDTARAGLYSVSLQGSDTRGNGTVDSTLYFTVIQAGFSPRLINFETRPVLVDDNLLADTSTVFTFSGQFADSSGLAAVELSFQDEGHNVLRKFTQSIPDSLISFAWSPLDTVFFNDFSPFPSAMVLKITNVAGNQSRNVFGVVKVE